MIPFVDDVDTKPFFDAARDHRLVVQRCGSCAQIAHLPLGLCPHCGSGDLSWETVRPAGVLHTWTVVVRQVHQDYPTPYTIVLVDHIDHPSVRFIGHIAGERSLAPGQLMRAEFIDRGGVVMPNWCVDTSTRSDSGEDPPS
ncbi:MAG: zinc ribbon domain-containing protein [Ilumatobacteraceae bacterium]